MQPETNKTISDGIVILYKVCYRCGVDKLYTDFHRKGAEGRVTICKTCILSRLKQKRDANLLEYRRKERESAARTKNRRRSYRVKRKAIENAIKMEKRQEGTIEYSKDWARFAVRNAIRRGEMSKQPCEICNNPKAQAHHDDYSKPLVVRWLCTKHHNEYHVKLRETINGSGNILNTI